MYNNINNNAIYLYTNSKSNTRKRKLFFSDLLFKVELTCINPEESKWIYLRCKKLTI